jgi:hypothetical protein
MLANLAAISSVQLYFGIVLLLWSLQKSYSAAGSSSVEIQCRDRGAPTDFFWKAANSTNNVCTYFVHFVLYFVFGCFVARGVQKHQKKLFS